MVNDKKSKSLGFELAASDEEVRTYVGERNGPNVPQEDLKQTWSHSLETSSYIYGSIGICVTSVCAGYKNSSASIRKFIYVISKNLNV